MSGDLADKLVGLIPDWFLKYLIVQALPAQLRGSFHTLNDDEIKRAGFDEMRLSNNLLGNCRADVGLYLENNLQ